MRQVPGIGDHGERRARTAVERLGIGRRNDAVASPQMTWVGTFTRATSAPIADWKKRGCHPKRALAIRLSTATSWYLSAGALRRLLADLGIGIGEPRLLLRIDHENVGLGNALDVDAGRD